MPLPASRRSKALPPCNPSTWRSSIRCSSRCFSEPPCCALSWRSLPFFSWGEAGAIYLVAGSLLYLVGTIGVTIALNVPLNDALAAVAPNSAEGAGLWMRYIVNWTAWNHVRTVAALTALASFIIALR